MPKIPVSRSCERRLRAALRPWENQTPKQALVLASARLATADSFVAPSQLYRLDATPVLHHLLLGLSNAGITRTVVALDGNLRDVDKTLKGDKRLSCMEIEIVDCGKQIQHSCAQIASAAFRFSSSEPLLLITNQLYDHELIRRMACERIAEGTMATTLIDDSKEMVDWAGIDHCKEFCKQGHVHVIVKMLKAAGAPDARSGRIAQTAKKMLRFDAVSAGVHLIAPTFFDIIRRHQDESDVATLTRVFGEVAAAGQLCFVLTAGLQWYSELVISRLGTKLAADSIIRPKWIVGAQRMLATTCTSGAPSPSLAPARAAHGSVPCLINLGDTIGEGAEGRVLAADAPGESGLGPGGGGKANSKPLAVKMIRKGRSDSSSDMEQVIMWEVHVLRELGHHRHIVKVTDVVDLVDSTYIVMERIDGPELIDFISAQPSGCLDPMVAARIFTQILQGVAHSHRRGYVHCDIKPQNIRLNAACDRAILTDFGYALRIGDRSGVCKGSPTYAPPELLTGYCSESISGRRPICPAIDVWSLGITLYQLLTGDAPFRASTRHELTKQVLALDYHIPDGLPKACCELIREMLLISPVDRISVDEMLENEWVRASGALLPNLGVEYDGEVICELCDDAVPGGSQSKQGPCTWSQRVRRQAFSLCIYTVLCVLTLLAHYHNATETEARAAGHGGDNHNP